MADMMYGTKACEMIDELIDGFSEYVEPLAAKADVHSLHPAWRARAKVVRDLCRKMHKHREDILEAARLFHENRNKGVAPDDDERLYDTPIHLFVRQHLRKRTYALLSEMKERHEQWRDE